MAEERAAILEESGMTRNQAEREAAAQAWNEHGVKLVIIEDAEKRKPLSGLVGRVFWPVNVTLVSLSEEEILDALSIVAMRTRVKYESKLTPEMADEFEEAILAALAAKHGISLDSVTR